MSSNNFVLEHVHYLLTCSNLLDLDEEHFDRYHDVAMSFLTCIDSVLEDPFHECNMYQIRPQQFIYLCKQAIERSFNLTDSLNIIKYKFRELMSASEGLSYFFLPKYLCHKHMCKKIVPKKKKTVKVKLECISRGPLKGFHSMKSYIPLRVIGKDTIPVDFFSYVSPDGVKSPKVPVFDPANPLK